MTLWQPTAGQKTQYKNEGYFIQRNVISQDSAAELRGVIRNHIMLPDPGQSADMDPMDPMDDSPQGRIARYRKLSNFCVQAPLIWHNIHAAPGILNIARYFLGDDIIMKSIAASSNRLLLAARPLGTKTTDSGATVKRSLSTSGYRLNPQRGKMDACSSYPVATKPRSLNTSCTPIVYTANYPAKPFRR